jgi:putative transposase
MPEPTKLHRTYRHRLYPTRRQIDALEAQLGFACGLYNAALQQRRDAWRDRRTSVRLRDQQHELTDLRRDLDLDMNYCAQEMVLQRLDLAFAAFFRRVRQGETAGFPRFRSAARFNTLSFRRGQGGAAIVADRLRIQGVGHIKVKWHRALPSEPKQTRITRRNGRWYVAFTVAVDAEPLEPTGRGVGVDLGVRQFATLSTGSHIAGPRAFWREAPAIRRAQRKVARRQRGSHRRRKAVAELARLRERERNRRDDAAHKAARSLIDRYDFIAVEDLKVRNMVRGNRGLAREITDQGWSAFLTHLEAKAESAGRQVVRVDPRNTSRRCHACGAVDPASRMGSRFVCTTCLHGDDADVNAAKNILERARTEPSGANATGTALLEKPRQRSRHNPSPEAANRGGTDAR